MSKPWEPYAEHILDAIAKIRRIQERGDIDPVTVLAVVEQYLQPLEACMHDFLRS